MIIKKTCTRLSWIYILELLQHFHRTKMTNSCDSLIFCLAKIHVIRYHQFFSWETRSSRPHLFRRIAVPKITEDFQKKQQQNKTKKIQMMGSDLSKLFQPVAIVKIDVLFGIMFHNRQTNNYMTSPVLSPLNILRICQKPHLAFVLYICNSRFYLHNLKRYTQKPVERL